MPVREAIDFIIKCSIAEHPNMRAAVKHRKFQDKREQGRKAAWSNSGQNIML